MTDSPDFFNSDDGYVSDPNDPFYGLPLGEVPTEPDPNDVVFEDVLERLGVFDFSGIVVDFSEANPEQLRGNRFVNLTDAIVYLANAGILQFGQVTIDEEGELGLEIDNDTGDVPA